MTNTKLIKSIILNPPKADFEAHVGYFDAVCERVFRFKAKEYQTTDKNNLKELYKEVLRARYAGSNGRWDRGNMSIKTVSEKELKATDFTYIF